MRVLYVTNGFPYPLTSGYLRHYFFIRELSREHRVTLLSVVGRRFQPEHVEAMAPYTERVLTFTAEGEGRWRRGAERLGTVLRPSIGIRQMRATAARLIDRGAYDAVVLSGKATYRAIEGLSGPPVIADMCDATSMRLQGQGRYASLLRRAMLELRRRQVCVVERKILAHASHVLFASVRDREAMIGGPSPNATVLPNGIDVAFWRRTPAPLGAHTLVFTGAMNYAPNVDAAIHLIRDILPLVRRTVPLVRLLIVGHSPAPALLAAAAQQKGVTVTGFVEDVRPYLEQASVFVAPIRFGAGIQNKLLEGLSMELPSVASTLAADGLRTEDGERPPVYTADTPQQFARAVLARLAACHSDPSPHAAGRQYVKQHFSWNRAGLRLHEIVTGVAGRGPARVARQAVVNLRTACENTESSPLCEESRSNGRVSDVLRDSTRNSAL